MWNKGKGFINNKSGLYDAIQEYGWDNIKKQIVSNNLTRKQAIDLKRQLINKYNSHLKEHGYNSNHDAVAKYSENTNEPKQSEVTNNKSRITYTVYAHVAPNKKFYIGQTCKKVERRWSGGKGYCYNKEFYQDILRFGWENITHIIICEGLNQKQANELEEYLIGRYNTTDSNYGYNKHNGGNSGAGIGLKCEISEYIIKTFLDNDITVMKTLMYFVMKYTSNQLKLIYKYITRNTSYIFHSIQNKDFSSNRKKAAYIFEIIKDRAFI